GDGVARAPDAGVRMRRGVARRILLGARQPPRAQGAVGVSPGGPLPLDLAEFIRAQGLDAEIASPGVPMPTVDAAAAAPGAAPARIFKPTLFAARDGRCVMAIACGNARVDAARLAALAGAERMHLASPEVALRVTGYPAGGTPPIGHRERFPVV